MAASEPSVVAFFPDAWVPVGDRVIALPNARNPDFDTPIECLPKRMGKGAKQTPINVGGRSPARIAATDEAFEEYQMMRPY